MFWIFKLSISAIKIKLEGNPHVLKLSPGSFTYVVQFNLHKASLRYSHFTETQRRKWKLTTAPADGEWTPVWHPPICQQSRMTWGQL